MMRSRRRSVSSLTRVHSSGFLVFALEPASAKLTITKQDLAKDIVVCFFSLLHTRSKDTETLHVCGSDPFTWRVTYSGSFSDMDMEDCLHIIDHFKTYR